MERLEDRVEQLEYYLSLLIQSMDRNKYPFYYLAMSKNLSKQDIENFLKTCEILNNRIEKQKEEGLIHFEVTFNEFKDAIPSTLQIEEIISTMHLQGIFKHLVKEVKKYI